MTEQITIHKLDHTGKLLFSYPGRLIGQGPTMMLIEAFFGLPDVITPYHHFRRGDRMVEWFYSDRGYNIFELHDVEDDHLKGWYCNITRPARLEPGAIYAEDLALDLMVYPDGQMLILDEEEFAALQISPEEQARAWAALKALQALIEARSEMFSSIPR